MRIFWPSDAPTDDVPGVLVGWRNSDLDLLVVGVLQGVDVRMNRRTYRPAPIADYPGRLET